MKILFVTGNAKKFSIGKSLCAQGGIDIEQVVIDVPEIQGEDARTITLDKARRAYEAVGKPVVVSDDSWSFSGLNGFPGPYMKSINHWFRPEDFINLTKNLEDKGVTLHQYLAYADEHETVLFSSDIPGKVLPKPQGESPIPLRVVVSLDGDNGKSLAEVDAAGLLDNPERLAKYPQAWNDLIRWYKNKHSVSS